MLLARLNALGPLVLFIMRTRPLANVDFSLIRTLCGYVSSVYI
jgi:hypothetical protein